MIVCLYDNQLLDPAAGGFTCQAIAMEAKLGQRRQPPKLPRYQSCTTGDDVVQGQSRRYDTQYVGRRYYRA